MWQAPGFSPGWVRAVLGCNDPAGYSRAMKSSTVLFCLTLLLGADICPAEPAALPKGLSANDAQAYLDGRGMGMAKPAELNGYPGPMHVLQLAPELTLFADQRVKTQAIFEQMHAEAVRLGALLIEAERRLDALFADGTVNAESVQKAAGEVARLHGSLRAAHLHAHVALRPVLSAEQVARYDELRGYRAAHPK